MSHFWRVIGLTILLASPPVLGQPNNGIEVSVKGMVCSFCVQGIEKKLRALPGVTAIKVDLKTKRVHIALGAGQTLEDAQITTAIQSAGYNVAQITRPTPSTPRPEMLKPNLNPPPALTPAGG